MSEFKAKPSERVRLSPAPHKYWPTFHMINENQSAPLQATLLTQEREMSRLKVSSDGDGVI